MKIVWKAAVLAAGIVMVGVLGCADGNEKEAALQGVAPPPPASGTPSGLEQMKPQSGSDAKNQYKDMGYPGAR